MDRRIAAALPLAFTLAMAADGLSAGPARIPAGEQLWRAGSLTQLLGAPGSAGANLPVEAQSAAAGDQMAQWLNFRNCFTGNWRNC
jgi:hypothetical protein